LKTITAVKGETTITLKVGSKAAAVGGKNVQLDVEAQIVNDRTLVPVRFISEAMGGIVVWDQATKTVTITK
jgi:spore coat protein H